MYRSIDRIISFAIFAIVASSCSVVTSNKQVEPEVEAVAIAKPIEAEEVKSEVVVEAVASVVEQVEKPIQDTLAVDPERTPIGPFTAGQSSSVIITEFGDLLRFQDFSIDLTEQNGDFCYPVDGYVSSDYGWRSNRMHSGVDLKAQKGDNIYAAFDGVVRLAKYNGAYGNCIVIRHYNGLETLYAHATKLLVDVNDEVKAGDVIALVGSTGRATGSHLHFEVRVEGQYIDPKLVINTGDKVIQDKSLYLTMRGGKIFASNSDLADVREAEIKEITSKKYHVIKSGDTLGRLAINNHTTVSTICKLNNISSTSILRIGQRVRVK